MDNDRSSDISWQEQKASKTHLDGKAGPYATPPDETERKRLREEVSRTHLPENLKSIDGRCAVTLNKPNVYGHHERVARFCIDPTKRPNQDRAPCALCSSEHPKYNDGSLLWSEDGYLRPIGHICAEKFFASRNGGWKAIEDAGILRDSASFAEEKLLDFIPKIKIVRGDLNNLVRAADFAQRQRDILHKKCPRILRLLSDLSKSQGGHLRVVERLTDDAQALAQDIREAGGNAEKYETVTIGKLQGAAFVASSYAPARAAAILLDNFLQVFGVGPDDEENQFDRLFQVVSEGEQATLDHWLAVEKILLNLPKIWDDVRSAWDFLSVDNLKSLDAWGERLGRQRLLEARLQKGTVFLLYRSGGETETVTLERPVRDIPGDA